MRKHCRWKFWTGLLELINHRSDLYKGVSPSNGNWITAGSGLSGLHYTFYVRKHDAVVGFVLEAEKETNKAAFDYFVANRSKINSDIGEPLI